MLKVLVAVKDTVAEVFHEVHTEVNAQSAIRSFVQSVKDVPHKDDYQLYILAEYDTSNGEIIPKDPLRLFSGHDVKSDNVVKLEADNSK